MKFGIAFANTGPFVEPDAAAAFATAAEANGFESLWTVEHVVVPSGYESTYPYSADGKMPGREDSPIPDPLIWLAYVAAATERIRLATGILILPQRNPVVLAKELATLDHLSGGRMILGIGIGWLAEEFAAIGVPFAERAARTDEHVAALRALWSDEPTHHGEFTSVHQLHRPPAPRRRRDPDPCRRAQQGGRPPRRTPRRRVLPGVARLVRRARRTVRTRPLDRRRCRT